MGKNDLSNSVKADGARATNDIPGSGKFDFKGKVPPMDAVPRPHPASKVIKQTDFANKKGNF